MTIPLRLIIITTHHSHCMCIRWGFCNIVKCTAHPASMSYAFGTSTYVMICLAVQYSTFCDNTSIDSCAKYKNHMASHFHCINVYCILLNLIEGCQASWYWQAGIYYAVVCELQVTFQACHVSAWWWEIVVLSLCSCPYWDNTET